jgi:hypothetical protein
MVSLAAVALASMLATSARSAEIEPGSPEDNYVQGNFLFLAYHEAGHMLMDQALELDQQSDRRIAEEAADDIATWLMLPDPDEPDQDEEILAAIDGWLQSANETAGGVGDNPHYPSDDERASRIACLVYGSNPELYESLAEGSDEETTEACIDEHEALNAEFEEWFGEHLIPPAEPSEAAIHYEYESAGDSEDLIAAQDYIETNEMLENFAEDIVQFVRLPRDVSIVAKSCGEGQAEFRYSTKDREIAVCYEAVEWFMKRALLGPEAFSSGGESGSLEGPPSALGSGGGRVKKKPVKK